MNEGKTKTVILTLVRVSGEKNFKNKITVGIRVDL